MNPLSQNAQAAGRFPSEELRVVEKSIRRILRASDLQSRALIKAIGLTAPQLVILKAIAALGEVTTTVLSAHADLSPATVITILDKLEERAIIERYRSSLDRRIVHTRLTEKGMALVANAPEPLGGTFATRFAVLEAERRREIVDALQAVADMMSAGDGKGGRGAARAADADLWG
ncbi:MarR family winged helix-turn-helix transcriptional regulator [Chelativorans alearense]|uniref:MarR family winged helix-turn-helix transcriptional regulator n=1 Tax=Chelativorans alearense TaxID=2681495 RepID=UPI0013D356B9|nr:MarR family winged helix-turn-helix transcriptional regulator [Chelativorans alearense]